MSGAWCRRELSYPFSRWRLVCGSGVAADSGGIDAAIAQALQLGERTTQTPQERLAEFMEGRRLCWSWTTSSTSCPLATLVGERLAARPGLQVLMTSREPLNLDIAEAGDWTIVEGEAQAALNVHARSRKQSVTAPGSKVLVAEYLLAAGRRA